MTDAVQSTPEYLEFLNTIKAQKIPVRLVRAGDSGQWESKNSNINWEVLWPNQSYANQTVDNLNNTSIVLKISSNNFSALFTGDAEETVQSQLITYNLSPITLLKVSHHGSSNAANDKFIKTVAPKIAVIEVGEHNMFGHPADSTVKKYQAIGAQIFRTDKNGTIEIIFNGQKFWTKADK
jgi:competence protein ComEC